MTPWKILAVCVPVLLAVFSPAAEASESGISRRGGLWGVSIGPVFSAATDEGFPIFNQDFWVPLSRPRIHYWFGRSLSLGGELYLDWDWRTPILEQFLGRGIGRGSGLMADFRCHPLPTRLSPILSLGASLDAGDLGTEGTYHLDDSTFTSYSIGPQAFARTGLGMEYLAKNGFLAIASAIHEIRLHRRSFVKTNDGPDVPPPSRSNYYFQLQVGRAFNF